jgi:nitric oxide dioxygenase
MRWARGLAGGHDGIKVVTVHETPRPQDRQGQDYDEAGLISINWLSRNTPLADADELLAA